MFTSYSWKKIDANQPPVGGFHAYNTCGRLQIDFWGPKIGDFSVRRWAAVVQNEEEAQRMQRYILLMLIQCGSCKSAASWR